VKASTANTEQSPAQRVFATHARRALDASLSPASTPPFLAQLVQHAKKVLAGNAPKTEEEWLFFANCYVIMFVAGGYDDADIYDMIDDFAHDLETQVLPSDSAQRFHERLLVNVRSYLATRTTLARPAGKNLPSPSPSDGDE